MYSANTLCLTNVVVPAGHLLTLSSRNCVPTLFVKDSYAGLCFGLATTLGLGLGDIPGRCVQKVRVFIFFAVKED